MQLYTFIPGMTFAIFFPQRQETLHSISLTETHFLKMLAGHFVFSFSTAFQILWIRVEKSTLKNKVWFGNGYL